MPKAAPLVLVVDDDAATRLLVREVLEPSGMRVLEAIDGEDALCQQAAYRPEAILLDILMPRLDGFEVLRRVRQRPAGAMTPIMVMTSRDDAEAVERAFELGATDFLSKPLSLPLLAHRMRYMLRAACAFQELHESARRLARAQRLARLAHWRMRDGLFEWASDPLLVFGGASESGRRSERGLRSTSRLPPFDLLSMVHPEDRALVAGALTQSQAHELDYRVLLPDGSVRLVHQDAEPDPSGPPGALFGATQDVTAVRRAEQQVMRLAFFDEATSLPNREFWRRAVATSALRGAVISIDLGISRIKDSLGAADDKVLLAAVARVLAVVEVDAACPRCPIPGEISMVPDPERWDGAALVARVGDDELAVMLRHWPADKVQAVAIRLERALGESFLVEDAEISIAASLGVAASSEGSDQSSVAQAAHAAMVTCRELGRSSAVVFDAAAAARSKRRLELSRLLHRAVAHLRMSDEAPEFALHYQPKIELGSGQLTGVEALLRWRPPGHGNVPPDEFVPIAEDTGVIVPLGEWVLRQACAQAARWLQAGLALRVAVNVSARQLRDPGFVVVVRRAAAGAELSLALLELELTEHVTMHDLDHSVTVLRELRDLGVQIALDDFGIGYSSLSYLSKLPIDVIKIDRSFILPVGKVAAAEAIPTAIIAMARSLGLRVVAEGVETIEQAEFLDKQGASELQGYLFARPMPAAELESLLGGGVHLATGERGRRMPSAAD